MADEEAREYSVDCLLMNIDLAALPDDCRHRCSGWSGRSQPNAPPLLKQKPRSNGYGSSSRSCSAANLAGAPNGLDDDQLQLGFEDLHADIARVEAILSINDVKTPRSRTERPSLPAHLPVRTSGST